MTTVTDLGRAALACPVCDGLTEPYLRGLYDDRYGYPGRFDSRRCRVCGHVFLEHSLTDDDLGHLYSDWYPRAARRYEELPPLARTTGLRAWFNGERHAAHSWVAPGSSVLDIGCGFGRTLAYHEARGCHAIGIEADAHAVAEARRHGLTVVHGLFDPKAHDPESFDYVTMDQVLEHSRDPVDFLTGVASVLKPGGSAVISTPNAGGYGQRLFRERWINWHVPYHLNLFTKTSLRRLAARTGLEVVSIRTTTASAWLTYQWFHHFSRPEPGVASAFWDPSRSTGRFPARKRARRWSKRLGCLGVFQLATRLADSLGAGDNLVAVLARPKRP